MKPEDRHNRHSQTHGELKGQNKTKVQNLPVFSCETILVTLEVGVIASC